MIVTPRRVDRDAVGVRRKLIRRQRLRGAASGLPGVFNIRSANEVSDEVRNGAALSIRTAVAQHPALVGILMAPENWAPAV